MIGRDIAENLFHRIVHAPERLAGEKGRGRLCDEHPSAPEGAAYQFVEFQRVELGYGFVVGVREVGDDHVVFPAVFDR